MNPLQRLRRLSKSDWGLLFLALAIVWQVRINLYRRPFHRNLSEIKKVTYKQQALATRPQPGRIARMVVLASRVVPHASCLTQALAAGILLRHFGYTSELLIGVDPQEKKLLAHAWLVCDGTIIIGGSARHGFTSFPPISLGEPCPR